MERGQHVRVKLSGGRYVNRIVWSDQERGILICTEEGFARSKQEEDEPVCVGFPREDVTLID
jgi:hypothetical protein